MPSGYSAATGQPYRGSPGRPRGQSRPHIRTMDKINIIVRLELANPLLSPADIAQLAGLQPARLSLLKRHPFYKAVHNRYLTGIITDLDGKVKENLTLTQETLNFAVPVAMQKLLQQALQEKDLRVQNKACNDLLDRHGRFAKVTRIGLPTEEQGTGAEDKDNKAAIEMLKALRESPLAATSDTNDINEPPITNMTQ